MRVPRRVVSVLLALSFVFVTLMGTTAESIGSGCSSSGGGSHHSQTSNYEVNKDKVKDWCKRVVEGDPSTYVYRWTDHKGHSGYKRGRKFIQPWIDNPAYSVKRIC